MTVFPDSLSLSPCDDARLRRYAGKAGLTACKSRRAQGFDNHGGYMLTDQATNALIAGHRYDLTGAAAAEWIVRVEP